MAFTVLHVDLEFCLQNTVDQNSKNNLAQKYDKNEAWHFRKHPIPHVIFCDTVMTHVLFEWPLSL